MAKIFAFELDTCKVVRAKKPFVMYLGEGASTEGFDWGGEAEVFKAQSKRFCSVGEESDLPQM